MYQQAEINGFLQVYTHRRIKIYLYYQCQLFPVIFFTILTTCVMIMNIYSL